MLLIENTHSTDKQTTPKMMCRCEFHIFTGVSGHFAEILPSSSTLYSDSLHRREKRSPSIFRSHRGLMVKSLVHRASLCLSLSMLSLTTLPFALAITIKLRLGFEQKSLFRSVNYCPLLAMLQTSDIKIKPQEYV